MVGEALVVAAGEGDVDGRLDAVGPAVVQDLGEQLPVPVAATAWGHRLLCGAVEPDVLARFVDERVGNGPEDVTRT